MKEIEKKRQWLAVNVMGYAIGQNSHDIEWFYYANGDQSQKFLYRISNFKPDQDIAQAMGLLDKYGYYDLSKDGCSNMALVASHGTSEDATSAQSDESKEEAIIEAVLQASGYYE